MANTERPHRDLYQEITDRIVSALESGTPPWRKPWDPDKAAPSGPINAASGHRYRGINVLLLGSHPRAWESGDPRWCSYKQAADKGWQVRKGEKATTVIFFKKVELDVPAESGSDEERVRTVPVLRSFPVFHASQVEGVPTYRPPTPEEAPWRRPEATDILLRNSGVSVRIGGERAFYSPNTDHIQLPPDAAFASREAWAATALHELGHATGHPSRLDRDLSGRFGSRAYAMEELRAEMASAFLGAELGIPGDIPNHASYVATWLEVLKQDKREVFRAAADAQRITDWCLARHPAYRARAEAADTRASTVTEPTAIAAARIPSPARSRIDGPRPIAEAMPEHLRRRLGLPTTAPDGSPAPDTAPTQAPVPAP